LGNRRLEPEKQWLSLPGFGEWKLLNIRKGNKCKQVAVWRLGSWGLDCWKDNGYYGTIVVTREPVTNVVSGQKWIVTLALPNKDCDYLLKNCSVINYSV
jgi:hypothetical protein